MPLYEYKCTKCRNVFERIQKFSDKPEADCPKCGRKAERQLSAPAVHFKGSGWYITDYARKNKGGDDKGKDTKAAAADKDKPAASKDSASKDAVSKPAKKKD